MQILQPQNWPRPKGYSNGIVTSGELIFISGQIGWDENEKFTSDNLVDQISQALLNTVSILQEAESGPEDIVRMTWFITDKKEYYDSVKEIGQVYRKVMGKHFPSMSTVQVVALMEDQAKVEIETTAVKASK